MSDIDCEKTHCSHDRGHSHEQGGENEGQLESHGELYEDESHQRKEGCWRVLQTVLVYILDFGPGRDSGKWIECLERHLTGLAVPVKCMFE